MGVNAYSGPRLTNRPHETPEYGPVNSKFEVDYYIQTYCSTKKLAYIIIRQENKMSRSNVFF